MIKKIYLSSIMTLLLLCGHSVLAVVDNETRFQSLIKEFRCIVCQNQSLADSNAEMAVDLRKKIDELIQQGDSDEEIKNYLIERFGEYILLKPRFNRMTAVLWVFPFIAFLFVIYLLYYYFSAFSLSNNDKIN